MIRASELIGPCWRAAVWLRLSDSGAADAAGLQPMIIQVFYGDGACDLTHCVSSPFFMLILKFNFL